jgi:glycosyltransferase involved in cell wall biosynthesis
MDIAKVVVLFPVYNGEKTLRESLDCIARQTMQDFRAIIVENRSTDGTLQLARDYCEADPRFSVFEAEEHVGALENFARAIRLGASQGEYFCLRAADDLSSPDFLETLVKALDADPDKLLAAPPTRLLGTGGDVRWKRPSPAAVGFRRAYGEGHVPRNLTFPAEWIYGVFRSSALPVLLERWFEFPNPWCFSSYVLSEFVVRDLVVYVENGSYDFREGSGSQQKYYVKSLRERFRQRMRYTLGCYKLVHKLPPASLLTRFKFFRMCWNDARRKTRYKLLWIF